MLQTVRQPREGAEAVLAIGIPRNILWELLFLVVVLSVLLGHLTNLLVAAQNGVQLEGLLFNPFALGAIQLALLVSLVLGIFFVGRGMGGTGSLDEAILLVSWLQMIMVALQVVQTALLFLLPPFAGLVGIAGLLLFLWLLTHFVAVLHGFQSLGKVFGMLIAGFVGFAVLLSIVLNVLGIDVAGVM
ncbi:MAG: YIP1 family protein [Rhodobacteraceae bacterium]|nr:YIP1 family protein [Paracoccaceae bacterium]